MRSPHTVLLAAISIMLSGVAPAEAATKPLKLQRNAFPTLAANQNIQRLVMFNAGTEDFPRRCDQLSIVKLQDLSLRWQPHIERLALKTCDINVFNDGETYLTYEAQATFKPGAATLEGLPVLSYDEAMGEMHIRQRYLVDAPIAALLKALRPLIERDCQPMLELNPMTVKTCTMSYDGEAWSVIVGELNHTVWLRADPDNPARSLYEVSGGD